MGVNMGIIDITNLRHWEHKRGTIGGIVRNGEDVKQCIQTIMSLQKGSVPFAPELGVDLMSAIGEKSPDAIAILTALYNKEIPEQEPRAEVISVTGSYTEDGRINMKVYFKSNIDNSTGTAEVIL